MSMNVLNRHLGFVSAHIAQKAKRLQGFFE
jgi:hypothetical protein